MHTPLPSPRIIPTPNNPIKPPERKKKIEKIEKIDKWKMKSGFPLLPALSNPRAALHKNDTLEINKAEYDRTTKRNK